MKSFNIIQEKNSKGRSFEGTLLAAISAGGLVDTTIVDHIRPVWAMWAGSEAELKPFIANLRLGRKAASGGSYKPSKWDTVEFLKSMKFQVTWQREAEGVIATIFYPDLFRCDPGMVDPAGIQFVMVVPDFWVKAQSIDIEPMVKHAAALGYPEEHLRRLAVPSYLFASYLDRRTRCPLVADPRFYLQILCAAVSKQIASFPGTDLRKGYSFSYCEEWGKSPYHMFGASGLDDVGISTAVAFSANHETFETFLAEQVSIFFESI